MAPFRFQGVLASVRGAYRGRGTAGLLIRAVVGSVGIRLVGTALGFLVGVQVARYLGVEASGVYGIAFALVSLATVPADMGLGQIITRDFARGGDGEPYAQGRDMLAFAVQVSLVAVGVLTCAWLTFSLAFRTSLDPRLVEAIWWGIPVVLLLVWGNMASAALRGLHHLVEGQVVELLIRPACVALVLFIAYRMSHPASLTPTQAIWANVIAALIGLICVSARLAPMLGPKPTVRQPWEDKQGWLAAGAPLALAEGSRLLAANVGLIMLGVFAMTHEAGLFRVAMSLYAATTLVGGLLNSVAAPVLVRLHHAGDTRSVMRLNAGIAASLVATSATALLAMIVFGRLLLGSIFGADFAPATLILIVLLGFELLATLVGNPVLALSMLGRGHAASRLSVVTMIAAVGLSLALIPSFGALGAAMALGASQMSWRMLCWWDARRHLGVETSLLAVFQVLKGRRAARLDV